MTDETEARKTAAAAWFRDLRDRITQAFEDLEDAHSGRLSEQQPGRFSRTPWERPGGGGGEMSIMRGRVDRKSVV